MKTPYSFCVIRYVHDVIVGEFVNVGVALYAPENNYIDAICTKKYGRLSKLFVEIDGTQFRSLMSFIEIHIDRVRQRLENELQLDGKPKGILEILYQIIPQDDSSLQFSTSGGGITDNPEKTLEDLYERYVERYYEKPQHVTRDDQEIWKVFKRPFEERRISKYLQPHRIVAMNYEFEFDHTWKNNQWRVLEPVSFDLENADSMKEKAARWLGRTVALQTSTEKFKIFLLLGKPMREELLKAYTKAENLLNQIPIEKEFIREDEAEEFAAIIKTEIEKHEDEVK
jgi:hypothetical protein